MKSFLYLCYLLKNQLEMSLKAVGSSSTSTSFLRISLCRSSHVSRSVILLTFLHSLTHTFSLSLSHTYTLSAIPQLVPIRPSSAACPEASVSVREVSGLIPNPGCLKLFYLTLLLPG